jgi:hypothetical protein
MYMVYILAYFASFLACIVVYNRVLYSQAYMAYMFSRPMYAVTLQHYVYAQHVRVRIGPDLFITADYEDCTKTVEILAEQRPNKWRILAARGTSNLQEDSRH